MATILTRIELALGANLTADPATWTWTDVSKWALHSVSVRFGRADEASVTQPTQCTFQLDNTDGRFTPRFPTSPYYPNVRRQTPVRVSMNPGTGYVQRFQGYIDVIEPGWPAGNNSWSEVSVTASGSLRRLGQGTKPLRSPLERAIVAEKPLEYWPCEDGSNSTQIASGLVGHPAINEGGLTFASNTGLVGSAALPVFTSTASIVGPVTARPSGSQWQWDWHYNMPGDPGADTVVMQINTTGTITIWQYVVLNGGTTYSIRGYDGTGALAINRSFATLPQDPVSGAWSHWSFYVQNGGGGTVNYAFHYYPSLGGIGLADGGSFSGTPGVPVSWGVPPNAGLNGTSLGHVVLYDAYNYTQPGLPAFGYVGETATDRLIRLCGEEGVQIDITGDSNTAMGPQTIATFLNLLRECEAADIGILYDGAGPGLTYLARAARYNQPVSLALDCNRQQVKLPFVPVEDDQRVRNDWTVSRPNGSSAHASDTAHIAATGLYDASVTLNLQSDRDLLDYASWLVEVRMSPQLVRFYTDHEAAHAVVAHLSGVPVTSVGIYVSSGTKGVPAGDIYGGTCLDESAVDPFTSAVIGWAGAVAAGSLEGCAHDLDKLRALGGDYLTGRGEGSAHRAAVDLLDWPHVREMVRKVGEAIRQHGHLDAAQFAGLVA